MSFRVSKCEIPKRGFSAGMNEIAFFEKDHKPSWKTYGQGTASLEVTACNNGWLALDAIEMPENYRGGKRVMITLDGDAVLALRDLINMTFPVDGYMREVQAQRGALLEAAKEIIDGMIPGPNSTQKNVTAYAVKKIGSGLTKREWIAGQMLAAAAENTGIGDGYEKSAAQTAVAYADALIQELGK